MSEIVQAVKAAVKVAMRAKDKPRLTVLRTINAEVKRIEVDERITLDDQRMIAVLDKMQKQRRDSMTQFEQAGRNELAATEHYELEVISTFLPAALSEDELMQLIETAITELSASSMADMGRVMAQLKPLTAGRVDNALVSQKVKQLLNAA